MRERIRDFYLGLSDAGGGPSWAGETLAIHFGLDGASGTFEDSLLEANRFLAERAGIGEGSRVLDAGCGVGGSSLWLARERGARVTGITLVPSHVEVARRHAAARGTGRGSADFQVLDFMETGLPEASFDVVWNLESLCHSHDAGAYFHHLNGLLRGGGRFVCLDIFATPTRMPGLEAMRAGCAFGELHTPTEVAQLLAAAGFADIEVVDLSARVRSSVTVLRDTTVQTLRRLCLEEVLLGRDTRRLQEQARGSLLCAEAVLSGQLVYGYVGARRAPR